ncbi:MAG: L-serine ammonia-lyase, iron-sulfur-dependent subunit beta [Clostridiales bacterium]|nr:L-serine ammonia-lyase, iron-sulfur-dependent subunit beta [Clostridiales bacterium]
MSEFNVFDIIGPIMIGPSSSHTAGANKIGYLAKKIVGEEIKEVKFWLHGSFAKTYKGHGTDRALLAGIMGMLSDDERIRDAYKIADEKGLRYSFLEIEMENVHPNTVKMEIVSKSGNAWEIVGSSIGAGKVKIIEINGMQMEFDGEYYTLITTHRDLPGVVAHITNVLASGNVNIAFMKLYREEKAKDAMLIVEADQDIPDYIVEEIKSNQNVISVKVLKALN